MGTHEEGSEQSGPSESYVWSCCAQRGGVSQTVNGREKLSERIRKHVGGR